MRVLITGGTGTLGHALIPAWRAAHLDDQLIVFSRDEMKQALMRERFPEPEVDFFLGDVRDRDRLELAFHGVDVVIHAAALKRVDSVANNPDEVFLTNVQGTRNVLAAARVARVPKVLLISTDKACEPSNAYGVSKAMAEHLTVGANVYGQPMTRSSVVRYGNVLGSRGSVLEVWAREAPSGLLTMTDPWATRFLLTPGQAADFIMAALRDMVGGEILIPDLPAATVSALGHALYPTARQRIVGMRPGGEKRHETLLTDNEAGRALMWGIDRIVLTPWHPRWLSRPPWQGQPVMGPLVSHQPWRGLLDVDAVRALLKAL